MANDKSVKIIYKDSDVAVCVKPSGIACEAADGRECMPSLVLDALGVSPDRYIGTVHRLDTVTEGLMVYSLNKEMTGRLSEEIANRKTEKTYLAIVHGRPADGEGELRDLLFRDAKKNKTFVVKRERKGVREAILTYKTLDSKETEDGLLSLICIKLVTGRTHQIRVQFSSRAMPLYGDGKYGSRSNAPKVALFSSRISFRHPRNGKQMELQLLPEGEPWNIFDEDWRTKWS